MPQPSPGRGGRCLADCASARHLRLYARQSGSAACVVGHGSKSRTSRAAGPWRAPACLGRTLERDAGSRGTAEGEAHSPEIRHHGIAGSPWMKLNKGMNAGIFCSLLICELACRQPDFTGVELSKRLTSPPFCFFIFLHLVFPTFLRNFALSYITTNMARAAAEAQ